MLLILLYNYCGSVVLKSFMQPCCSLLPPGLLVCLTPCVFTFASVRSECWYLFHLLNSFLAELQGFCLQRSGMWCGSWYLICARWEHQDQECKLHQTCRVAPVVSCVKAPLQSAPPPPCLLWPCFGLSWCFRFSARIYCTFPTGAWGKLFLTCFYRIPLKSWLITVIDYSYSDNGDSYIFNCMSFFLWSACALNTYKLSLINHSCSKWQTVRIHLDRFLLIFASVVGVYDVVLYT